MNSNIKWIMIFTVICAICIGIYFIQPKGGVTAQIKQGNNVIKTINLSEVSEPYEIEVTDEHGGYNKIRIEHGRIAVIDADCPDKICVHQGYIENGAVPIVCLPHKLSITIIGAKDDTDAVTGGR